MQIIIVTSSKHKKAELTQYFDEINLPIFHFKDIHQISECNIEGEYLIIQEQTSLLKKDTLENVEDFNLFQEVEHHSNLKATFCLQGETSVKNYHSKVNGYIAPHKKKSGEDQNIYNWDDVFISKNSNLTYQEMKRKWIKNSARDLVFALFIEDNKSIFELNEKANLNFNQSSSDEVISFDDFIPQLLKNNKYYKISKNNVFFRNIIDNIISRGLFVRKAENRSQKNYWMPGLNAGLPLVAKKDEIHELTFMFHDLMHFIYPDLIVTDFSYSSKRKYILSRMMSEAITIVLADMFFISLLSKNNVDYDFNKRKIFPIFDNLKSPFEISLDNFWKMKHLLFANVVFALLGDETLLRSMVKDQKVFEDYKEKYQPFFKEDYVWTEKNYKNMLNSVETNNLWYNEINKKSDFYIAVKSAKEYLSTVFDKCDTLRDEVVAIFNDMMERLENFAFKKPSTMSLSKLFAVRSYMLGQMNIFYKYDLPCNEIFKDAIFDKLNNKEYKSDEEVISSVREIYRIYLSKLREDKLITNYREKQYLNIYPIFPPFYVFYDRNNGESFNDVINRILN